MMDVAGDTFADVIKMKDPREAAKAIREKFVTESIANEIPVMACMHALAEVEKSGGKVEYGIFSDLYHLTENLNKRGHYGAHPGKDTVAQLATELLNAGLIELTKGGSRVRGA